jgi:hypothetical protein
MTVFFRKNFIYQCGNRFDIGVLGSSEFDRHSVLCHRVWLHHVAIPQGPRISYWAMACPKWVRLGPDGLEIPLPFYPLNRTSFDVGGMSVRCQ